MKKTLMKAFVYALTVSIGITIAKILCGQGFSVFNSVLFFVVALVVDFVFTLCFNREK